MKKILSILYVPALLALSAGFAACSDDDDEAVVGPASQGAFFPNNSPTSYYVEPEETGIDILVMRSDASAAQTVNLSLADENGLFKAPSSVAFAAGESQSTFTITFDATGFLPKDYSLTLSIPSSEAYMYGMTEYTFTVGLENTYRWNTIGKALYYDAFCFESDDYVEVTLEQHALNKTQFRINTPYKEALEPYGLINSSYPPSDYIQFRLLSKGESLYSSSPVKVTMDDLVYFDNFCTGYWVSNYGDVINCYFPGTFSSTHEESNWTYNKVISWQDGNQLPNAVQFAPWYYMDNVGGWNYTQSSGMITIIFPGGRLTDASVDVEITNVVVPEDGSTVIVSANITLGADVTEARVGLVQGNDAETGNFLITHDRTDYTTITSSGEYNFTLPADAVPGPYMLIASTYMGSKAMEYNYDSFTYSPAGGEPWTYVCTGTYTYDIFFGEGDDDPGLEVYQSNDDPTLYKIEHWGYDVDFYFHMDENNFIVVDDNFTGYTHSSYGDVYVTDLTTYFETTEVGISFYKNGVFNFNVVYYVDAGYFGYGYETFKVTSYEKAPAATRKAPKNYKPSAKMLPSNAYELRFSCPASPKQTMVK